MRLLGYPGWFAIRLAMVLGVGLLWYPGWLLRCCYAVAKVPRLVARVLLRSC